MATKQDPFEQFLFLSVVLTGFEKTELLGTGMAKAYYDQVEIAIGKAVAQKLWAIAGKLEKLSSEELDASIRHELMDNPKLGPLAQKIIQLWYWGAWIGNSQADTHFVTAAGYQEGLVWKAMESHPAGAKQPGFGSWSLLPGASLPFTK